MTLQEMLVNDRRKIDDIRLSINRKELEYYNYINTHRYNVKYAFIKYGEILVRSFLDDFNGGYTLLYSILENRVSNHDNSKTASSEYDGYRMRFHPIEEEKDFATDDNPKFAAAWKHHYTNNDHHPEYYYIYEDVILKCINFIKKEDYNEAYNLYKNTVLSLENVYLKNDNKKQTKIKRL